MSLIYRAVWDDDWCQPLLVLDDEFKEWCIWKGIDEDDIPRRGRFQQDDSLWIEVRRADAEIGRALRCTLSETDPRGRTWTTTATALADHETRSFWVDLECDDPGGGEPEMAAPRLVRGLIANGGRPTSYGLPMRTDARRLGPGTVDELVGALLDPARQVPIVVFSPDLRADPPTTIRRADATAQTLAGLAHVYAVSPPASTMLNEALREGFGVYGGAVRMYLPPLRVDDPDDAYRHRWIPARLIAVHPRRAASMLARRLARLQLHPPIPSAWGHLAGLLRRPTELEVDARASQISNTRAASESHADEPTLRAEIEDLTKLLAEADLVREAVEEQARWEISRLEAAVVIGEADRYDDADELEDLRRERDGLQRTIRALANQTAIPLVGLGSDPHDLDVPISIGEAIDSARTYLERIEIHDDAPRDIDELEATAKYQVWASAIWQGLLALHDYAAAKRMGMQPPGFKLWCEQTGAWPTSKLAMTESETVLNNDQLRNLRHFPISTDIAPSGRLHMFAHLKIQAGGGGNIPRLYFYDDTDGASQQIHVGFIGPHRYVRNTKS
ncbi:MAG: hypothetical protein GEV08_16585 [Acidimicrobiia bacterium]|nr:hypothetical protein [Acidimicrobiia bacterium]